MNKITLEEDAQEKYTHSYKKIQLAKKEINSLVFGQSEVIDQIFITLLSRGHALIIGLPGLAKTRIVNFIGIILGLNTKRIQFTPDLMPNDILGNEILDDSSKNSNFFRFLKGPVFSQLLLADEINRASPRTQSALLQSMQEKKVTVAGKNYDLPSPFHVLATQNPIDQEGTYPLPEAQLDRFLMNIKISYPKLEAEKEILILSNKDLDKEPAKILDFEDLLKYQSIAKSLPVGESIFKYILDIINNSRPETTNIKSIKENVLWGPSPRASLSLLATSKSKAFLEKRFSPSIMDVKSLVKPILMHRLHLNISAKADGVLVEDLISDLLERINV